MNDVLAGVEPDNRLRNVIENLYLEVRPERNPVAVAVFGDDPIAERQVVDAGRAVASSNFEVLAIAGLMNQFVIEAELIGACLGVEAQFEYLIGRVAGAVRRIRLDCGERDPIAGRGGGVGQLQAVRTVTVGRFLGIQAELGEVVDYACLELESQRAVGAHADQSGKRAAGEGGVVRTRLVVRVGIVAVVFRIGLALAVRARALRPRAVDVVLVDDLDFSATGQLRTIVLKRDLIADIDRLLDGIAVVVLGGQHNLDEVVEVDRLVVRTIRPIAGCWVLQ